MAFFNGLLGNTVGTLQTYRWMGTGPEFTKIGRRVVYSRDALIFWRDAGAVETAKVPDLSGQSLVRY